MPVHRPKSISVRAAAICSGTPQACAIASPVSTVRSSGLA